MFLDFLLGIGVLNFLLTIFLISQSEYIRDKVDSLSSDIDSVSGDIDSLRTELVP
jgi:hypothetical protein